MTKKDLDDLLHDAETRIKDMRDWQKSDGINRKNGIDFLSHRLIEFIDSADTFAVLNKLPLRGVRQPGFLFK